MKLSLMLESNLSKAVDKMRPILKELPKKKIKHSVNVAKELKNHNKIAIYAALGHDYLERGGDIADLVDHLADHNIPDKVLHIIKVLSQDEDDDADDPLEHMQDQLPQIHDEEIRNNVILIKMADRLDNLRKRYKKNELNKKYVKKSRKLIHYLMSTYNGTDSIYNKLVNKLDNYL